MFFCSSCKKLSNLLSDKSFSEQIIRARYICVTGMESENEISLLMKGNCAYLNQFRSNIPLHYNKHMARSCLQYLIKQNCFLKTLQRIVILMTQVSLYMLSLSELIWNSNNCNIHATPKLVKKVITNFDSSKDCILEVVLKNCKPRAYSRKSRHACNSSKKGQNI